MRRLVPLLVALGALALHACTGGGNEGGHLDVRARILSPAGTVDPYAGLDSVRVAVEQGGIERASASFAVEDDWSIPKADLDFDAPVVIRVDGIAGGTVVRTGRTAPFVPRDARETGHGIFFSEPNTFAPAPSAPNVARLRPAVARLADGRVLIAGGAIGTDGTGAIPSVEIYDPDTGIWSDVGMLSTARHGAAAVPLEDGRVLVAGGVDAAGALLASAELVTPPPLGVTTAAGVAPAAPLPKAWDRPATALLGSGRVLLAGGWGDPGDPPMPALYDAGANAWSVVAGAPYAAGAPLAALPDGRAVLAGGGDDVTFRQVTVFSSGGDAVSTPDVLRVRRHGATVTPLDASRVLVTGGARAADGLRPTAAIEVLDVSAATPVSAFAPERDYHHRAFRPAVVLRDGAVLLAGGTGSGGDALTGSVLRDPSNGRLGPTPDLPAGRSGRESGVPLADGTAMLAGSEQDASVLIYNPSVAPVAGFERVDAAILWRAGTRTTGAVLDGAQTIRARFYDVNSLVDERTVPATAANVPLDGFLVGYDRLHVVLEALDANGATLAWGATAEPLGDAARARTQHTVLLGRAGEWTLAPDALPSPHTEGAIARFGDRVVVVGGRGGPNATDLYDPTSGATSTHGGDPIPTGRDTVRSCLIGDDRLMLAGGQDAAGVDTAAVSVLTAVNGTTLQWSAATPLASPVDQHTVVTLANGDVLAHGNSNGGLPESFASRWNGTAWAATNGTPLPRDRHVGVRLADDRVLLAGGEGLDADALEIVTAEAELFDPADGSFTPTGPLATARRDHAAFADGTGAVLCGGVASLQGDPTVHLADCERWDPGTGQFSAAGNLQFARDDMAVVRLADGDVLILGGSGAGGSSVLVDRWSTQDGTVAPAPSMVQSRAFPMGVALPDGRAIVAGGNAAGANRPTVEVWTPATWRNPFGYDLP